MIGFLEGTVVDRGRAVVTVVAGGVGYEVRVAEAVAAEHPCGAQARFWTHLAVRDQAWDLIGFLSRQERDLFRVLLRVPQIGTKTALAMLSTFNPAALIGAVTRGEVAALTTVPGIGKKSAERVIVELRDILRELSSEWSGDGTGERDDAEALRALVALGYSAQEARRRLRAVIERGVAADDLEGVIRAVLLEEGGR